MSFLGDLVGDVLGNLFTFGRTDKKLARLLAEGETLTGTLDGIRITGAGDSAEKHVYSVTLTGPHGPWRASVDQRLNPGGEHVRLGMTVPVRHLKGKIAIDWPAALRGLGVPTPGDPPVIANKTLKKPLEPGIHDWGVDAKRLERGRRTEARLVGVEPYFVMGMPTQNMHLDLVLPDEEDRSVRLSRFYVPGYARGLLEPGTMLPVAVDPKKPDRITVDWPLAATRAAGR